MSEENTPNHEMPVEPVSHENEPKGKRLLDVDVVKRMKDAGLPKPPDVPHSNWNQVQDVKAGPHTLVAHLAACGLKAKEIAEQVGLSPDTVKRYLASEKIKFEIRRLQHNYFGKDPMRRFQTMIQEAGDVLETVMRDEQIKPSIRVMAADKILDRAVGKPKQFLQVEGSLIRKVYESLDQKNVTPNPNLDKEPIDIENNPNETVIPETENPNAKDDKQVYIDDWVEKFFK